ncbi:hypothetical protein LINPERPRIM_LOCUS22061 [Linum perenne]
MNYLRSLKLLPRFQRLARFRGYPVMEEKIQSEKKVYFHYSHTEPCEFARWTARESFEFMEGRPWQQVVDFYSNVVNGKLSLFDLFEDVQVCELWGKRSTCLID